MPPTPIPSSAADDAAGPLVRAHLVLVMLLIVYTFNFLDRQILSILATPIKADLHLSDAQFGAVGGLAFAILYSLLGVPLAFLADRTSRSGVVMWSLVVWSGFTALCGTPIGLGGAIAAGMRDYPQLPGSSPRRCTPSACCRTVRGSPGRGY